ncbi:hypothetical protein [Bacillus sp. AK128]
MIIEASFIETRKKYGFVISLILFLSALPMSIVFVSFIQTTVVKPESALLHTIYSKAYLLFCIGVALLAVATLLITLWKPNLFSIFGTVGTVAIASYLITLSFHYYIYIDEKGVHVNPIFTIKESFYQWEDVESVTQINRGGRPETIEFTIKNTDKVVNYNIKGSWFGVREEFTKLLRENDIQLLAESRSD